MLCDAAFVPGPLGATTHGYYLSVMLRLSRFVQRLCLGLPSILASPGSVTQDHWDSFWPFLVLKALLAH